MKSITVVLYGPSGCGKSTLARRLCKCGFNRIQQLTTREPVVYSGSHPGVVIDERKLGEYDFVSELHFLKLLEKGAFAEMMEFDKTQGDVRKRVAYGSLAWEYNAPGFHVVTTNIEGAAQLAANSELESEMIFVEFVVPRASIILKATSRGRDSLEEVMLRSVNEKKLYYVSSKWDVFPEGYMPDIILYEDDTKDAVSFMFGRYPFEPYFADDDSFADDDTTISKMLWERTRPYWYTEGEHPNLAEVMDSTAAEILEYVANRFGSMVEPQEG